MQPGSNPKPRSKPLFALPYAYPLEASFQLPPPQKLPIVPFFKVVTERKSVRSFCPIDFTELSTLLAYTAKVKSVKVMLNDSIVTRRFSASAGGVHPIDLLLSMPAPITNRQLYYYNPFYHQYVSLKLSQADQLAFFEHVNECLPLGEGVLIWMLAHLHRTERHYENPLSLVWRDAGALLNVLQLSATALEYNSCPVGTLAEPFIQCLFKESGPIISAGGIIVGKECKHDT